MFRKAFKYDFRAMGDGSEHLLALLLGNPRNVGVLAALSRGDFLQDERAVPGEALAVFIESLADPVRHFCTDCYEIYLHK